MFFNESVGSIVHLKQNFPKNSIIHPNTFIINTPTCSRHGVVTIFLEGNKDSSKIIIVRMANGEQVNINNLTSFAGNKSAMMGIDKGV
jgi:hypothetical protein